jgi:hypothetical protein
LILHVFAQAFLLTRPWGLHADDGFGHQRTDLRDGGSVELPAGCGLFAVAADGLTLRFSGRKQLSAQPEGGSFTWNGHKRFWSLPCGSSADEAHFRLLIESGSRIEAVNIKLVDAIANPRDADEDSAGGQQKRLQLALVRHVRSLVDDDSGRVEYHALGRKLLAASVPWEVATEVWCRDASPEEMPPLDIIVRHAETLQRNIDILANHPRRVLKRIRERQPIGRLEELDSACLEWYVRQPGRTALEKAGTRQVLLGVARHENFDTLENRVLRAYLRLAAGAASAYTALYAALRRSQRMAMVERFGRVCRLLDRDLDALEINLPSPPILPNYVLQQDVNYRRIWQGYLDLLRRKEEEDDIWRWQSRLWGEFSRLSLLVALRRLDGAHILAETPLLVRSDQQRGRWLNLSAHPAVVAVPIEGRLLAVTVIDAQAEQASQFGGDNIWGYLWSIGPACVMHAQDVASGEVTWVLVWGVHPIDGHDIDLRLEVNSADAALSRLRDRIRAEHGELPRMRGIVLVSHPSLDGEASVADRGETMAYRSSVNALSLKTTIDGLCDMLPVILGA